MRPKVAAHPLLWLPSQGFGGGAPSAGDQRGAVAATAGIELLRLPSSEDEEEDAEACATEMRRVAGERWPTGAHTDHPLPSADESLPKAEAPCPWAYKAETATAGAVPPVAYVRGASRVTAATVAAGVGAQAGPVPVDGGRTTRPPSGRCRRRRSSSSSSKSEQLVNEEPDLALITDPLSGRPIVPGQRQVGELNAMLDTPGARNAGSFLHPTEYGEVYGGVSSGDGASGDGASGAREGAGGAGGGGKKPRVEDAGEHGSADEMET